MGFMGFSQKRLFKVAIYPNLSVLFVLNLTFLKKI